MATVVAGASSRTALFVLRHFDVTRLFAAKTTITKYQHETWCRRWRNISQRNLSTTTNSFSPRLSSYLNKDQQNTKDVKEAPLASSSLGNAETKGGKKSSGREKIVDATSEATVEYHLGLPKFIVQLPSRREKCQFILKPITHTVGDFLEMLKAEDRGIDRAQVTTKDGVRIASSNTVESLLESDFILIINDNSFIMSPPPFRNMAIDDLQKLSEVRTVIARLYDTFHAHEESAEMEKHVLAELEEAKLQLEPLQQQLQDIELVAQKDAYNRTWWFLLVMSFQFGALARATWWEYSWDIMEPFTYFVTYATGMTWYMYYLVTREEYGLHGFVDRQHLRKLHRNMKKFGFQLDEYNRLKDKIYTLDSTLQLIRGPLHEKKVEIDLKRRQKERSSSSSSRSPSSSPSPSPSPSPERTLKKRATVQN